ncbi:MAG: chorismate mutase [Chloroflexi bacterium]|nr:chorismate mutase [Chloroflexota bacterium]
MPLYENKNSLLKQQPTACRGVRGAVTVKENSEEAILIATRELFQVIAKRNEMHPDDIASIYITTTPDLNATYPALAARQIGWRDVALLCGHEMNVPGGLQMCIRVMIHWNTTRTAQEIVHVYLRDAQALRPDRQNLPPVRPRQMNAMEAMVKVMASVL